MVTDFDGEASDMRRLMGPEEIYQVTGQDGKELNGADESDSGTIGSRKNGSSGKPPRHLSTIRHCISYAQLAASSDLVRIS